MRNWFLLALGIIPAAYAQNPTLSATPPLSISPDIITRCVAGNGRATLTWNSGGPGFVQIRVGGPNGVPMTGLELSTGMAQTGDWVSNGLVFSLMSDAGAELARVTAKVSCV